MKNKEIFEIENVESKVSKIQTASKGDYKNDKKDRKTLEKVSQSPIASSSPVPKEEMKKTISFSWDEKSSIMFSQTHVRSKYRPSFFEKIFNFCTKITRLQKINFENQQKQLLLMAVAVVMITFGFLYILFLFSVALFTGNFTMGYIIAKVMPITICVLCYCIFTFLSILFHIIFQKFQIFLFLFNTIFVSAISFVHLYDLPARGGVLQGSPMFLLPVSVVVASLFGNYFQIFLWIIIYLTLMATFLSFDSIFVNIDTFIASAKNYNLDSTFTLIYLFYVLSLFNSIEVFIVTLYYKFRMYKQAKLVKNVGNAVASLIFDGKGVRKLLDTPKRYLTNLELLLKGILVNISLYKEYLPDHIINESANAFKSRSSNVTPSKIQTVSSLQLSEVSHNSSFRQNNSFNSDESSSSNNSSFRESKESENSKSLKNIKKKHETATREMNYGLSKKFVVLMLVRLVNLETVIEEEMSINNDDTGKSNVQKGKVVNIESVLSTFLNVVSVNVRELGGLIDVIQCDRIQVSFGSDRLLINSEEKACFCALKIAKEAEKVMRKVRIRISLMKKEMYVGNIKSMFKSKKFIVSSTMGLLTKLNYSKVCNVIVMDELMRESSKYIFLTKQVDLVKYRNVYYDVYSLMEAKKMKNDEWLYQLKDQFNNDCEDSEDLKYQKAWELLKEKKFAEAEKSVKGIGSLCNDVNSQFLLAKIRKKKMKSLMKDGDTPFSI